MKTILGSYAVVASKQHNHSIACSKRHCLMSDKCRIAARQAWQNNTKTINTVLKQQ